MTSDNQIHLPPWAANFSATHLFTGLKEVSEPGVRVLPGAGRATLAQGQV